MASSMWTDLANQYGEHFAVPPALILSLIDFESGGDPNKVNPRPDSNATGLMQVTGTVLKDYNKRHNLKLSMEDLKDPATNIRIGAELLRRIALTYEKRNGIAPRWDNKAYVGLIAYGWNAGYAAKRGVSNVLSRLEAAGVPRARWNVDVVYAAARKIPSAIQYLKLPGRVAWSKRVASRATGIEDGAKRRENQQVASTDKPGWSTTTKVLVYGGIGAAVIGTGYALLSKGDEDDEGILGLPSFKGGGSAPIIIINK